MPGSSRVRGGTTPRTRLLPAARRVARSTRWTASISFPRKSAWYVSLFLAELARKSIFSGHVDFSKEGCSPPCGWGRAERARPQQLSRSLYFLLSPSPSLPPSLSLSLTHTSAAACEAAWRVARKAAADLPDGQSTTTSSACRMQGDSRGVMLRSICSALRWRLGRAVGGSTEPPTRVFRDACAHRAYRYVSRVPPTLSITPNQSISGLIFTLTETPKKMSLSIYSTDLYRVMIITIFENESMGRIVRAGAGAPES